MVDGLGRVRARPGRGRARERRPRDGDARPVVFPSDVDIWPRGAGHCWTRVLDTRCGRIPGLVERVDDRRDQCAGLGARRPLEPWVGFHASCARVGRVAFCRLGSPREWRGHFFVWLFGTAERNARRTSRGTRCLDRSPWTLSRRPSPSTTRRPVKVARRTSVRAFAGHHSARASRVPRRASSARPEDPLTPSRLPRSRVRRQPHPGAALHPHPGTVVHEPGIRGETRHARVRRTFAPAALPTRCPRSAPTVPRPRPSVSG